jgi:propanol-preferring alcohol dehydrogenase
MRAWHVDRPGPVLPGTDGRPSHLGGAAGRGLALEFRQAPVPEPGPGELLLKVAACGVCRTDLHVVEGDLPVRKPGVIPGHEIVGDVVATGPGDVAGFAPGERAGAAWLRSTDGTCRYCLRAAENLCPSSTYTGWDADGGYAQYALVPAGFAHRLPAGYSDAELAPLLCAGIIGYRALKRAELPPGGRLGIYGFGGSAHLAAQVALAQGAEVFVMTRGAKARDLARRLGAAFTGGPADMPPVPLDSAILFAPAGDLVLPAMAALDRGGTLAIAGIYLTDIPAMSYDRYLFQERQVRSVTSNTREDAREFLRLAGEHRLEVTAHPYPLDAAAQALADLKSGRFDGAAVLIP